MPLVDYAVNYNFIAKNLCENREWPQLMCQGKCYLKKELAEASGNQTKNDSRINIYVLADSFIISQPLFFTKTDFVESESSTTNTYFSFSYNFSLFSDIFRPPLI